MDVGLGPGHIVLDGDPKPPKRVAQKSHLAILQIEVTRASHGLSAIAELLVTTCSELRKVQFLFVYEISRGTAK